jgi:hypothetical protein
LKLVFDLDGVLKDDAGLEDGTTYSLLDRGRLEFGEVYLLGALVLLLPLRVSDAGFEYFFDLEYTSPRLVPWLGFAYFCEADSAFASDERTVLLLCVVPTDSVMGFAYLRDTSEPSLVDERLVFCEDMDSVPLCPCAGLLNFSVRVLEPLVFAVSLGASVRPVLPELWVEAPTAAAPAPVLPPPVLPRPDEIVFLISLSSVFVLVPLDPEFPTIELPLESLGP